MVRTDGGGVKWYFAEEQDGNGKVRIYTKKGPLKHKEEEYGEVVNITPSKSDAMDEKLKVTVPAFISDYLHDYRYFNGTAWGLRLQRQT